MPPKKHGASDVVATYGAVVLVICAVAGVALVSTLPEAVAVLAAAAAVVIMAAVVDVVALVFTNTTITTANYGKCF